MEDAKYNLKEACRLYTAWGADAKAARIQRLYEELFVVPQQILISN